MKIISFILLLLGALSLKAQSFKERLVSMQQEYAGMDTVHINMTIEVYEDEKSISPYFSEVADIKRQSQNYQYQFGGIQMLMNTTCLVMVDKDSREIIYTTRSPGEEAKIFKDPLSVNLDSILLLYENPDHIGNEKHGDHYRILQKQGAVKQIDLFLDTENNRFNRIEYRYDDSHYVVIQFTRFDKHPAFGPDTFSEKRYVIEEMGKLKAARDFPGYRVATVDGR